MIPTDSSAVTPKSGSVPEAAKMTIAATLSDFSAHPLYISGAHEHSESLSRMERYL